MAQRIRDIITACIKELSDPYYQAATGSIAFFYFLSVLPAATLISQIMGIFSLSIESIGIWLAENYSEVDFQNLLYAFPEDNLSPLSNIVLLLVTIWSASKAQHALTITTDYINNDYQPLDHGFVKRRARSFIIILVVLALFVLALAILVYAPVLIRILFASDAVPFLAGTLWNIIRWPILFLLYYGVVLLLYVITPYKPARANDVKKGALLSSVGFIVVTIGYSVYFKYSAGTNIIYGSMAQIVAMLMWFWLISWVICIGIVINKVLKTKEAS